MRLRAMHSDPMTAASGQASGPRFNAPAAQAFMHSPQNVHAPRTKSISG